MEMQIAIIVLAVAVMIFTGGSISLVILARSSPNLRGIRWLAGAFASLSVGACLLLVHGYPWLSEFTADLALLLTFVLFQMAVFRLLQEGTKHIWIAGILSAVQIVVDCLQIEGVGAPKLRVISLGFLIAIEALWTALVLWRSAREQVRAPATFSVVILMLLATFNLCRSTVELLTSHQSPSFRLTLVAFVLYLCNALGMGFGFFWMTTAMLTGELEHMASTDPLTRLFNRRTFLKWCEKELSRSERLGASFSLLIVDLDRFKQINDEFGHLAGDQVLCAAVEQMQDSVRGLDVLCRWGGEEFAVLLPNTTIATTRVVAERIRANIQKVTLPASVFSTDITRRFHLTASLGTATFRTFDDDIPSMLQRADEALYRAKREGRNRVLETV